ncbi:ATM1 mitochondrial ABC transporter [Encephalitozoon intestinalis ATCC 50506]|uniref:ATM1 mitochondrial ABC transporter n=1 Tax=Encephalitozoon intestinalis (strain ATCC 50506) TaxID=876142 RepID=E0S5L2_ENCIT|nr:ATM1 mitochondrial ABC transporter [Encephalitozoon intestinalis ATCC 50506]XP_003072357.2 ATM1 mitochondrial ABC transporter [Encephalitozoon intestinalis ATCC 50506]UTX44503.1 ABC transporter [Encephalitozoon intestinalis]ADM10871.1 ATM1 mitochondrial ABC transporter [Encephalitozoon intestinalis ATCC 50506]ADM10997.2 ATM1 mitochondrial ABC transporter [Encephalitozoon intestinalis ATCC 50506]UTX44635.1 ABC transporter protein [Encephalitozoon intestinalis]UTX45718.1 ABC transporter [Enc
MKKIDRRAIWSRLASMLKPTSPHEVAIVVVMALCIVLGKWLDVASIKKRGSIIDTIKHIKDSDNPGMSLIFRKATAFLVLRTLSSLFIESKVVLFSIITNRIVEDITSRILYLAIHASHACEIKPTSLNRIVERGNKKICKVLTKILTVAVPAFFNLVLLLREVYRMFGLRYLLPILFTISIYAVYTFVTLRIRSWYKERINYADNSVSKKIHECVSNMDLVKTCCCEQAEVDSLQEIIRAMWTLKLSDKGCVAIINFGQRILFTILFVYSVLKGTPDAFSGTMTIGDLATLFSFVFSIDLSMWTLGVIARDMGFWLIDCEDLLILHDHLERMARQSPASSLATGFPCPSLSSPKSQAPPAIEFEGVSFGYPNAPPILRNLSFKIARGERVGIIGRPGSGKSSILRLIPMLHSYTGSIRVNGLELRNTSPAALRASIACILQDMPFFDETVFHNISYGLPATSLQKILEASRSAGLGPLLVRRGLHSAMKMLSGGEVQMVSIARCLLQNKPLMLLDEVTSRLDASGERAIFDLLMGLPGKTVVMVFHDLWMAEHMDRIILMDAGRIVESGSHGELMELRGEYWRMKTGLGNFKPAAGDPLQSRHAPLDAGCRDL